MQKNQKININSKKFKAGNYTTREDIRSQFKDEPGLYIWWMPVEDAKRLGVPLAKAIIQKGLCKVYIGIAKKSIAQRIYWHICEENHERTHSPSKIKWGYISSLRKSLCGLLQVPMNEVGKLNELVDRMHFQVKYDSCERVMFVERNNLSCPDEWYPLNTILNRNPMLREFIKRNGTLSTLRKASRGKALKKSCK